MIYFKNISKFYPPDFYAVKNINLHINPGEFISIVGRSGAGKTTLIKLLIAEERPSKGRVVIGGWDITDIKHQDVPLLRRQIGVIFQDFKLLSKKTIFENIAFALEVCKTPLKDIRTIIPQVLKIVGLEGKEKRFPWQLSTGEQQRVAIARALSHQPKVLLADEPTGNLDTFNTKDIIELLEKINNLGTTVVLVSHDREVINYLKKRVVTMDNGVIVSDQEKSQYIL